MKDLKQQKGSEERSDESPRELSRIDEQTPPPSDSPIIYRSASQRHANVTVHAFGAAPSLPLNRLTTSTYRIADDPDADLHVPGFDTPAIVRTVLVLAGDSLREVLEVEHLGKCQEIAGTRIELRAPGSDVYVVIEG